MLDMEHIIREQVKRHWDPSKDYVQNLVLMANILKYQIDVSLYNLIERTAWETEARVWENQKYAEYEFAVELERKMKAGRE